ncbi:MAG: tRNA 2-thiouridine(34) synthase MnmA [Thermodesulfobacteriota bacterium]|nr:tRNA 2-thiouridine(34) synthase MnmA [Thermodesulfobacteriota bacterium]
MKNNVTVAVLVSGGVDSLVAAALLKDQYSDVTGLHFLTGYHDLTTGQVTALSRQLDMPIHVLDFTAVFKQEIIDCFIAAYLRGETPNPCMRCNRRIKFGEALVEAGALGAEILATGHYCNVSRSDDAVELRKGTDTNKEQSYFLAFVGPSDLAHTCFPVGDKTKSEVMAIARERGLTPVTRQESQDICFVQAATYADFIQAHTGITPAPGPIVDMQGNQIGEHSGIHQFTVGQRRGINCPAERPYYVAAIDAVNNKLTVGFREELLVPSFFVRDMNWLLDPAVDVDVKVRYRHPAVPARLTLTDDQRVRVDLQEPQFGIAPGQGAVFYDGDTVVGGGVII